MNEKNYRMQNSSICFCFVLDSLYAVGPEVSKGAAPPQFPFETVPLPRPPSADALRG